jgi:hypothetical protein
MAGFSGSIPTVGAWFSFAAWGHLRPGIARPSTRHRDPSADRRMDVLAEGVAVERGLAIPLDDARDLRAPGLGAHEASQRFRQAKLNGMAAGGRVDALGSEEEFAFVAAVGAALFGAATGENTPRYGDVLRVDGQDKAVSEIGGHDRRLAIMDLGEAGLGIGVDEGLPIDPADPFQRAHKDGVRAPQSPRHSVSNAPCTSFPAN